MDLVRILITRSAPYTPYFIAVLVLQALSTAATLYLPSLNAKIIDEGVSQGDVDFIWRTGGIMLAVAFAQVINRHRRGMVRQPHRHGRRPRSTRRGLPPR